MNDIDFEEKQLLFSLHHRQLQPLNLPGPNDNINTDYQYQKSHYIEVRKDYRYHESHHESHHMEPTPVAIQNSSHHHVASTVSMSTEEDMLDNFELNLEGDQPDITESGNTNTINTDLEPLDATTISTKSTTDKSCLVTPDLPRNVTMESSQLPATKPKKKRKPSPPRPKDPINKKPARVETPTPEDILCGQSRVCASHPGNRNFQQILEDFAHNYDIATSKQEKMQMTKAVVSIIHESGGRFLKFKDGMWEEISTVAARDKVSHALRTKVSSWKRQHQQLLQKERDVFAPPRRVSLSRKSRKRERNSYNDEEDDDVAPLPLEEQSSLKVNDLLQSQQAFFAQLNASPTMQTPMPSPRSSKSNHHTRHSFGGSSPNHHYHHSRRSSSSF